ncbi:MAG: hypothetical protein LKI18_04235 [Prevotella sp.]|nr:hypothetical protein [Prevotella sp.]
MGELASKLQQVIAHPLEHVEYDMSKYIYVPTANAWYRILSGDSLAGERPRSLFIMMKNGCEVVYKMTAVQGNNMTFTLL